MLIFQNNQQTASCGTNMQALPTPRVRPRREIKSATRACVGGCRGRGARGEQTEQRNCCYGDNELEKSRQRKQTSTGGCEDSGVCWPRKQRGREKRGVNEERTREKEGKNKLIKDMHR